MRKAGFFKQYLLQILVLVGFVLFPIPSGLYFIEQLTVYLTLGIFAMSLGLIWGHAGIISFGHAAFFGIGGYFMTLVTKQMIPYMTAFHSTYVGLIFAIIMPAALAAIIGYFLFPTRMVGPFFAIIMLTISIILERIAVDWYYVGGFNGIFGIPPLRFSIPWLFSYPITNKIVLYYVILGATLACYLFCRRVVLSPFGNICAAIMHNQDRTEFFGYNMAAYKIKIFTISGGLAGLAGALFVGVNSFVSPTLVGFNLSAEVLMWTALGGRGVLLGPLFGAIAVRLAEAVLSDIMVYYWILLLGLLFTLSVMFFPKGLFGHLFSTD